MGNLIFVCPQTSRPIETGIETNPDTLAQVKTVNLRVTCAHCGEQHLFRVADGYLDEAA